MHVPVCVLERHVPGPRWELYFGGHVWMDGEESFCRCYVFKVLFVIYRNYFELKSITTFVLCEEANTASHFH